VAGADRRPLGRGAITLSTRPSSRHALPPRSRGSIRWRCLGARMRGAWIALPSSRSRRPGRRWPMQGCRSRPKTLLASAAFSGAASAHRDDPAEVQVMYDKGADRVSPFSSDDAGRYRARPGRHPYGSKAEHAIVTACASSANAIARQLRRSGAARPTSWCPAAQRRASFRWRWPGST